MPPRFARTHLATDAKEKLARLVAQRGASAIAASLCSTEETIQTILSGGSVRRDTAARLEEALRSRAS